MAPILPILEPLIDSTIERLRKKKFAADPIAGEHFSRIVSVMSSAYKRHGHILQRAILEQLKTYPDFLVWDDPLFQVSGAADHVINSSSSAVDLIGNELNYTAQGQRTLQVDAFVFHKPTGLLRGYEVKRGFGVHDSGKKRSILRDTLCVQLLLKSYGRTKDLDVLKSSSHVIFYYGRPSIQRPFCVLGSELDSHFGVPVREAVEEVNQHFRSRLFAILSG